MPICPSDLDKTTHYLVHAGPPVNLEIYKSKRIENCALLTCQLLSEERKEHGEIDGTGRLVDHRLEELLVHFLASKHKFRGCESLVLNFFISTSDYEMNYG